MNETGEIVLSRVVIPEYVIVHDGVPEDPTARNYWVRYKDYIKMWPPARFIPPGRRVQFMLIFWSFNHLR